MGFDLEFSGEIGGVAGQPSPPPAQEPITAPTGEYDVYIRKLVDRDERKSAADRSMAQAITKNPDEYARYVRLSKLTGMDPDMLLEEPDMRQEAERRVKKNSLDFDSLIKTNPKTVEFLSDPQNATIAQDDVPFFQRIENSFKAIGSGYRTAEGQEEMFGLARKWMDDGKLSPVEMARLEKLQGDEAHKARLTGMEGTPEYVGRSFGYSARQFMGSMKATMFGAGAGGIAGFGLGFTAPVVGNVAGGTAGIVAGGLTGGAVYSYDMERAGAFLELSRVRDLNDQPINQSVVKTVANAVGVVNAVIEMSSDFMVARMIPGVKDFIGKLGPDAAKAEMRRRAAAALSNPTTRQAVLQAAGKLGGGASIEGIEEFIQSLVGAGGREVAQATSGQGFKDDAISDDLKQASSEALQAFTGILFLMAPVGGMHYANMRHQQRVQRDNKEFFDALAGAADSKAHQRLPEKTREFVEHLKQEGGAKDIFIDADRVNKYFQSKGVDASLVMEQVLGPEGANQFNQALALKADVVIPVEAYAEKLAGTEHHQGLAEDLRLRQGDMSEREFKLAEANLSEDEKTLRTMAQDAHAQIVADEPAQRIYQEMYGEALAGGGATPTQASTWAAIQAAHMRSRFSKLGPESQKKFGDAYGLWKAEYGITIRRPMPEVLSKYRDTEPQVDALLNAMRERKIPQESPDHQFTDDERALVASVNELGTVLEAAGLDVDTLTNEQIRAQLFRQQEVDTGGGTVYNTDIDDQTYAQSLDVYQYSNGLFGFTGDNFMLSAPQDIGAWIGDTRSISYDITAGRERLGTVVLAMRGPEVIGLSAIEIDESGRGQGLGRAVVEELLDTYGRLEIYGIRDSARGFWNKLGVKYDETQSEFERNGILETDAGAGAQRAGTRQAAAGGTFNQEGRAGRIARPGGNERTVAGTAPRQNWVTNTAIRGRDGLPLALLRGENRPLSPEDFKPEAFGYNTGHASSSRGVHFTNSTGVAEKHGTIRRYWLDVRKPFVVESDDDQYSHIETPEQYFTWRESLRQRGYDGIIISTKNIGSTRVDIVAFDPEQVIPVPEQQTFYQSQKADRLKLTGIARHWVIRNEKLIDWGQILSKPNGAQILTDIVKARVATELGQDGVKKYLSLDLSGYLEILAAQGGGFHNEELARAIQAYQSDKVKAVKAIEKWVAGSRKEVLNEWHGYLTGGNDAYANNPFFQDYVWNGITSELRNNRPDIPASLNPAALAIVYDSLMERPDGRKFMPLYSNALEQVSIDDIKDNAVDLGAEKEWIKISQAPKGSEDHKKNSELLRNLSCSTWCTSRGMEKEYVASGDFWVLRHGGGTKLAIRFNGDGEVVEIQGQRNDGTIPLEYAPDVKALVNSGSVKLGASSMAALKRALAESSRITKIAAMSHNKLIKYFNLTDLGDGTYAFTPPGRNSRSVKTIETLMKSAMWPLVSSIGGDLILHEGTSAPNVTSVGGGLYLYKGASAPNVTSVGGDLYLYKGASASNVTSVGGNLSLYKGTFAPNVTSVGGDLRLYEGTSAPNITSVGGNLYLYKGASAPDVTSVGGNLSLHEGASAPNITSVGRDLYLDGKIIPTKNWPKYGINAAQPGFDITPGLRANALSGLPLFQKKLGSVTFGDDYRLIQLLEDANLSTFLHELSHTWLEEFQADAARPDAGEQVKKDWDTTRRWLGLAPGEAISVEAHEQWARGGEAYFMEGNAPSIALREIFQKFKAWMQLVYKNLSELDVKLNDDIRAVFDRLIATDEEIENARRFQMYAPVFSSPEQAGMTSAEWSAYTKATANSRADAQDQVTRRVMRELQRENEKWWKDELAKVEGAVRAEAMGMPVYKALWLLSKGEFADGTKPDRPIKLSKQGLINSYGEPYLKELAPKKLRTGWIYAVEGGVHHDVVAGMVGFDSGDEMIKAITSAAPINEWVEAEAKQRMLELHGDMLNDGSIAAEAIIAVHNDRQAEVLETELRILRRKRAEVEPIVKALRAEDRAEQRRGRGLMDFNIPAAILRDMARREIGGMRVGVVDPMHYAYAEARAGREALDLMAEGDFDGAAEAKQRQIMNHFFYREALRARKDVDRGVGHMTRLSKTKARARIGRAGQEWLEQLDAILERYSLSPMTRQSKARGLLEWAKAVEQATGESVALSPEVMDEAHMINYRELTVDQFRALHDSVSSIEHVARKITQVIRNGRAFEKGEMVNALVNAAEKSLTSERPLPETDKVFGQARTAWELTRGFFAANLRPEKIIERLDGGTEGVWHDLFWNPAIDAQTRRDELRIMVMKPLIKMQEAMGRERQARMSDGVHLKTIGKTLTRRTLIGVALNVGNASNRDKLMRGGMWFGSEWSPISDVQLSEMLDQLDAEDWKMVQGIWDAVGLLYPHLDDLNRRAVGLPLDRVQLTPITTKHGVFNGGYWPAVADPRHSKVGEKQENAEALATELFAPRYPKAATMHSFREARTEAAYPIQLDWERVLANHVSKAITDIAYHEWIKQSRRLLENQKIKKVIQNRLGEHVYRSMEEWLVHQVRPIHGGYMANAPIDNITNSLVSNTVIAALGFKAATAIGNIVVAPMQASHQVKSSYMVRALAKYLSNPAAATEAVFAMSGEMRHRYEHLDQTFNTVLKTLEGRNTIRAQIGYWAMQIHRLADRWTSTFIWMAKYQQEVDGGKTPEQAQRLADKTIRTTQMAGAPKDLSSFERDPRYRMFKMFIGPMIVMQNEMRGAVAGKGIKAAITPQVWATMFATWIMPAVMFEMAVGRGPDDDDEWWEWALLKILVYPAMTVPFVRDAANAIEQMISGKHATTRSNPISDVVMLLAGTVRQALKEDAEIEDFVKAAAKATGVMVGLPTSQVMITGEFMYDNITGNREMEEPADLRFLIYKRRKGE